MWCAERLAPWLAVVALGGCSLGNRIDTCDAPVDRDVQVNAVSGGDQYPTHGRALARLSSGRLVAVWVSEESPQDGAPSHVRAALLQPDGKVVPPCGSVSGEVQVSTATNEVAVRPSIAVGPTADSPIFVTWRASPAGTTGAGKVLVRLLRQDLCPYNTPPLDTQVFTLSDDTEDPANPVVAVRAEGNEALVAWLGLPRVVGQPWRIRSRPVGVTKAATGAVEPNGCDGREAPCTHASFPLAQGGVPALTALGSGYGLAWPGPRADSRLGYELRVQRLDRLGTVLTNGTGQRTTGEVQTMTLAVAAVGETLVVAQAVEPMAEKAAPADDDVYVEWFGADGKSTGAPKRVNALMDGPQKQPAIAVTRKGGLFVTWQGQRSDTAATEVFGRLLSATGEPLFTGLACDATDFIVSSGPSGRRFGASVAGDESAAYAVFADATTATGGTDTLGLSVHFRRVDVVKLAPQLK